MSKSIFEAYPEIEQELKRLCTNLVCFLRCHYKISSFGKAGINYTAYAYKMLSVTDLVGSEFASKRCLLFIDQLIQSQAFPQSNIADQIDYLVMQLVERVKQTFLKMVSDQAMLQCQV